MTTSQDDQTTQDVTTGGDDATHADAKPDIDQLKHDIEQTRSELGDTVDALSAKLDVKSRTKARVGETKERAVVQIKAVRAKATTADGKPEPAVLAGAGGVAAVLGLVTALIIWRKRR